MTGKKVSPSEEIAEETGEEDPTVEIFKVQQSSRIVLPEFASQEFSSLQGPPVMGDSKQMPRSSQKGKPNLISPTVPA